MEQFDTAFDKASKILVISNNILTLEKAYALVSLNKALQSNGKEVDVLLLKTPSGKLQAYLDRYDFTYITEVKPRFYELWVNYGKAGIEKVTYDIDERDEKLKFQITPGEGKFSFDDVEFREGGSEYDFTITFGVKEFKKLGKLYEDNEYLFKKNFVLSFVKDRKEIGDRCINLERDDAYSEAVYNFLKASNIELEKDIVEMLLNGTINHRKVLEGNADKGSWEVISSMASSGADVNKVVEDVYYSKSEAEVKLQIKLSQNVQMRDRVIWSYVSQEELNEVGIKDGRFDVTGRIPFNISKDFDFAVAMYQISNEKVRCIIESNFPSRMTASSIVGVWGGKGGESHGECVIKGAGIEVFDKEIMPALKDLGEKTNGGKNQLEVDVERGDNAVTKGKVLTKGEKNSKNKG